MLETRAPGSLGRIAGAHLLPGLGRVERVRLEERVVLFRCGSGFSSGSASGESGTGGGL